MSPEKNISTLLRRVAQRDGGAFSQLYQLSSAKLFGIILRILRRRDIAEEVLQEVYVKIWERAADFNPEKAGAMTWMSAIARNRAIDEVRRKQPASIEDYREVNDVPSESDSSLAELLHVEESKQLADCLQRLEPGRRQMVVLAYCDGASREELGKRYDQPVNTIKTWLRRSLAQLKDCLGR